MLSLASRVVRGLLLLFSKIPCRRCVCRLLCHLALIVVLVASPLVFYTMYINAVELRFFDKHMRNVSWHTSVNGCTFPSFDPFDSRWKGYFFDPPVIDCGYRQPYLTYVDQRGMLRVNYSGARDWGLERDSFECMYSYVQRPNRDDFHVSFSPPSVFYRPKMLQHGFVRAQCLSRRRGSVIYETGHAWVPPMPRELAARVQPASPLRPSVLLIGIDSMSRLNFIRQMKKTHALLRDALGAIVFNGLIKVGDNTYPNMLTMLTGIAARKKEGINVREWGNKRAFEHFDELPIIWNNFSENGYVTMYAEDEPEFNAFNYMAKGFHTPPTHYYMRPFWLAMETMTRYGSSDGRCYHNFPNYQYLYNYTKEFVTKMKDRRYFALNFLTSFSHNKVNDIKVVDDTLHAHLSDLHSSGALRSAVVVVFGDHGNRFDALRATVVGRVEERMPYLAVALPPDLRDARPYLLEGLRANVDTLLSWYDVYETLADIALDNLQPTPRVPRFGTLGTSLFRTVPQRTCLEAGVPEEFCVCSEEVMVRPTEPEVVATAEAMVAHVNALLEEGAPGACAPLVLDTVVTARKLLPTWQVSSARGFVVSLLVTVRAAPSGALLEATLERDAWDEVERVVGDVARINAYGSQSHCVRDPLLRLYCFCKGLPPKHSDALAPRKRRRRRTQLLSRTTRGAVTEGAVHE